MVADLVHFSTNYHRMLHMAKPWIPRARLGPVWHVDGRQLIE